MTNPAFIYNRPSKWPVATALGAVALIHLSASNPDYIPPDWRAVLKYRTNAAAAWAR